jgi:hypothetical protein
MGRAKYLLCRKVLEFSPDPTLSSSMLMAEAEKVRIYSSFLAGGKLVIWFCREGYTESS